MTTLSPCASRQWNTGGWRPRAACRGMEPDLFFPHGETAREAAEQTTRAKKVCNGCPVRLHCLLYALAAHPQDGIWGGLTVTQRARLRHRRLCRRSVRAARRDQSYRGAS